MRERAQVVLVVGLVVLVYAASLPGTFQYDDHPTILQNEAVRDPSLLPRYFVDADLFSGLEGNAMYRPVLLASYLLDYGIAGYHPTAWHLTNILIHALNAVLVLLLTRRLLAVLRPGKPAGYVAFFAALAFALHPVHSEVVNYVSSRSSSLATVGFLGALLLHLAWTRGEKGRLARVLLAIGSMALLAFGFGGKEIAVAAVPVAFALDLIDPKEARLPKRFLTASLRVLPLLAVAAIYLFWLRPAVLGSTGVNVSDRMFTVDGKVDLYWGGGRTIFQNLLTQARVFWMYAALLLFPHGLAVDRFVRVSTSFGEPAVIASVAGIAVVLALLLLAWRKERIVTFAGGLYIVALLPTSSVIPLNVLMNEHRLYLPGVGIAILMGLALGGLHRRRRKAATVLGLLVAAAWVAVIVPRSLVWQDPLKLWQESVRVSPGSFRSHNQLGAACIAEAQAIGVSDEALPVLERAIRSLSEAERLYPDWYNAPLNLGIAHRLEGEITRDDAAFAKSIEHFERCRELSKNEWRARYQIATTYGAWGKREEAIRRFLDMAEEDRPDPEKPRNPLYLRPVARMQAELGLFAESAATYREILEVAGDDLDAVLGLARALAGTEGPRSGVKLFQDLLARKKDDPDAHIAFARFLIELDPPDRRGASHHFQKALQLGRMPTPAEMDRFLK